MTASHDSGLSDWHAPAWTFLVLTVLTLIGIHEDINYKAYTQELFNPDEAKNSYFPALQS